FMWFGTMDGLNKYDGYGFTVYKHDFQNPHSLSDNSIQALFEDEAGVLWIGTRGGLNSFDRRSEKFTRYVHDPNNPHSLSHNTINAICETRQDSIATLWVGTTGGLHRFEAARKRFLRYQHDPNDAASLSDNAVRALHVSRCADSTVLWVGTLSGLDKLVLNPQPPQARFIHFKDDSPNSQRASNNRILSIVEEASGALWLGTFGGGLKRFDPRTQQFEHYRHNPKDPASLRHNVVRPLAFSRRDSAATLWIGTSGGLEQFDMLQRRFVHHQHDEKKPGSLSNNDVWSVHEDRSGTLWIGTYGGGLNKFSPARRKFAHMRHDAIDPHSLGHNMVMTLLEARNGDKRTLWVGTGGGGLYEFDAGRERFIAYRHDPANPNSLSNDGVAALCQDHSGALWIGTAIGLNRLAADKKRFRHYLHDPDDPNTLSGDGISAIVETPHAGKSFLWIGTGSAGLNRLDPQTGRVQRYQHDPNDPQSLSHNRIFALHVEPGSGDSRTLWIGTDFGLNRLTLNEAAFSMEGAAARFTRYQHDPNNTTSLSSNRVFSFCNDPDSNSGMLWIGTWGGGLNRFDRERGAFTCFTEKDGLPNDVIYGILCDADGKLWLSTNNGLSKFDPVTRSFRNYDVDDGLQSNEFNQGAYCKSRTGEMFFGGINGFNRFYPEQVRDNPYAPPIALTAFEKFDKLMPLESAVSEAEEIKLSYRDNFFSFVFAALDYSNPAKNQYAYKLEGFDEDWIYCGTRRYASYTNLDGGEYLFRVKGSNHDGVWNETGVAIRIIVTPPFWKTWWFLTLFALVVGTLVYSGYRRKLNARLEKARIVNELKAAHDMQMGLMPTSAPNLAGFDIAGICQPAEAVGGDFFDYFLLDAQKNKFGVVLVDVSDKAMKGAMTAVLTSGVISAEIEHSHAPAALMQNLNRVMYSKTPANAFIAMLFGMIDLPTKTLRFANAGLTRPLLRRGQEITYLNTEGKHYPLGILQNVQYEEMSLPLQSGDVLVFYTDGLPEAMNEKEELFDYSRLERTLRALPLHMPAAQIILALLQEVQRFVGTATHHDDLTIVVVRVA
ncbi:SpoIIE family protein phosphatase, partial [candidate division KSB1 bacterium]|nr:SpoIIE family protein phosphatase [candidate division KSB1 bacterium]